MQFIYLNQTHVLTVKYWETRLSETCLVSSADQQYAKTICICVAYKTQNPLV